MRPHFLLFIIPFIAVQICAQINEDFSDGDFTNNPTWQGDVNNFIVNTNNELQLNAPSVRDTSFLSVETGILDFSSNVSWEFYVKLDLSPSNSNNFRFYLTSDNANLKGSLNGYFIRVGVKGGGCSGLMYELDFDNILNDSDKSFEDNGIKVVVDKKSFLYLVGTTLDFSGGLNGKGFVFNNPNADRTCGCGESFSL